MQLRETTTKQDNGVSLLLACSLLEEINHVLLINNSALKWRIFVVFYCLLGNTENKVQKTYVISEHSVILIDSRKLVN